MLGCMENINIMNIRKPGRRKKYNEMQDHTGISVGSSVKLFINDVELGVRSKADKFADYTKLFMVVKGAKGL